MGRPFCSWRSMLLKAFLVALNIGSTALTLFTGLRENSILVMVMGTYDGIRQRFRDGSINYEIASAELFRLHKLPELEDIGTNYRIISAPRRDPDSIGEYRSICTNLNSNSAPVMTLMYDDFWGKGPRRKQLFVYSISAPLCEVLNVKPAWRTTCIETHGSLSACYDWVLANYETLQQNRHIQVGVAADFGMRGVPLLRCIGRPNTTFPFQADLLNFQTYWSGATNHMTIQTSECNAIPLTRDIDLKYGLFEAQGQDEGADVLLALPPNGWFTWIVTEAYNIVTLVMIIRGLGLALLHKRAVQYLPHRVRYSPEHRFLRYLVPFMPAAISMTDNPRLVITFKGSLLVGSDMWMNHWLYMYLSILDALANIRLTYITLQVGTWMLNMKLTLESFLFICTAIMKMTWIMCLLQTLLRATLKLAVRVLRSIRLISSMTRERLAWDIDGMSLFLSYKLYGALLCLILGLLVLIRGSPTYMVRATPYKVGVYGGSSHISRFWQSELVCDLLTILATLTACGQVVGIACLCSRYRRVADNSLLRLLQRRYRISGWDGLLAANMLGLDPHDPACLTKDRARAQFCIGSLLQMLYLSGPSAFVHLAGDSIFHDAGLTREPVQFRYPASLAVEIGLLDATVRGSFFSRGSSIASAAVRPLVRHSTMSSRNVMIRPSSKVSLTVPATEPTSLFDRTVRVVSDGYFGKVLLVDEANSGVLTTNEQSGLYEFIITDALTSVTVLEIQQLIMNTKPLVCE